MLLAAQTAMENLSDAGRRNVPRDQLVTEFRKMSDSMWRWYVPVEQSAGRTLYRSIADKLLRLPEGETGAAFPPTRFVEEEMAALNARRVALSRSQPALTSLFRGR